MTRARGASQGPDERVTPWSRQRKPSVADFVCFARSQHQPVELENADLGIVLGELPSDTTANDVDCAADATSDGGAMDAIHGSQDVDGKSQNVTVVQEPPVRGAGGFDGITPGGLAQASAAPRSDRFISRRKGMVRVELERCAATRVRPSQVVVGGICGDAPQPALQRAAARIGVDLGGGADEEARADILQDIVGCERPRNSAALSASPRRCLTPPKPLTPGAGQTLQRAAASTISHTSSMNFAVCSDRRRNAFSAVWSTRDCSSWS